MKEGSNYSGLSSDSSRLKAVREACGVERGWVAANCPTMLHTKIK